jgi:ubiquinone/menaquinone biosynthesis C-methylase UbiE
LDSPGGGFFVLSTATRLPFADSIFDGVVCIEVIEHIPELGAALSEIARVLKPGGRAIIIDKNPVGVGYHRFYPNWLYKAMMERLDRWSYPKGFPSGSVGRHRGRSAGSCEADSPVRRSGIWMGA